MSIGLRVLLLAVLACAIVGSETPRGGGGTTGGGTTGGGTTSGGTTSGGTTSGNGGTTTSGDGGTTTGGDGGTTTGGDGGTTTTGGGTTTGGDGGTTTGGDGGTTTGGGDGTSDGGGISTGTGGTTTDDGRGGTTTDDGRPGSGGGTPLTPGNLDDTRGGNAGNGRGTSSANACVQQSAAVMAFRRRLVAAVASGPGSALTTDEEIDELKATAVALEANHRRLSRSAEPVGMAPVAGGGSSGSVSSGSDFGASTGGDSYGVGGSSFAGASSYGGGRGSSTDPCSGMGAGMGADGTLGTNSAAYMSVLDALSPLSSPAISYELPRPDDLP